MDRREASVLLMAAAFFNRARTFEEAETLLFVWRFILGGYGNGMGNDTDFFICPVSGTGGPPNSEDWDYLEDSGLVQNAGDGFRLTNKGRNRILEKTLELNAVLGFDIVALIGIDAKILSGRIGGKPCLERE